MSREQSTGRPEQEEKMVFKTNKRRVIVAVKDKQRLGAGEEMRVAYSWTKKTWAGILERTVGAGGSDGRVRRGWIQGDSLEVEYRGRLGEMYQVIVGEHGGTRSEEDGAVKVSDSDLWKETRLGAPVAGGVWDRVQGQRIRGGSCGLRQDSEAGEGGGAHGHSKEGNRDRKGEGDDDEAAMGEEAHRREARRWREIK